MGDSKGVIYLASGKKHIREAKESAKSLKEHNDIEVVLFTPDEDISQDCFDRVLDINRCIEEKGDSYLTRNEIIFDKNLYLDSDTYISSDISEIFELLDRFEIVMSINEARAWYHKEFYEKKGFDIPRAFPEYNSGVIGFRNKENVRNLFSDWETLYQKLNYSRNQPALRKILYESEVVLGTLPPEYNFMTHTIGFASGKVKILHKGNAKTDLEKWSRLLNNVEGKKVTTWEEDPVRVISNSYTRSRTRWERLMEKIDEKLENLDGKINF